MIYVCENPASWHPTLHVIEGHHHPPSSWRLLLLALDPDVDQSWWRIVQFCGLDHGEYHTWLDAHVRARAVPPASLGRTYGRYIRSLVAETWEHRPVGPRLPYTLVDLGPAVVLPADSRELPPEVAAGAVDLRP